MNLQNQLIEAIPNNDIDKIQNLLKKGVDINYVYPPNNITALVYAIRKANIKTIEFILDSGADKDYDPGNGNGMYGTKSLTPLLHTITSSKYDALTLLLKKGANPNFIPTHGMTPIKYAILVDDEKSLKILIDHGGDIDLVDKDQRTPLEFAIIENQKEAVELLLIEGAAILNEKDAKKVYYHSKNADIQKILLKYIKLDRKIKEYTNTGTPVGNIEQSDEGLKALASLESMIGLDSVKENIRAVMNNIKIQRLRDPSKKVSAGHYVFQGNPGTGKTSVARIMHEIFRELGVLDSGHLVEVTRSDLVGEHVGATAKLTQAKLEEAKGGILFIDEAYSLVGEGNDFGQEAINTIVPFMETYRDDFILIAAGYRDDMANFLDENVGLKSRFSYTIDFEDYNNEEMIEIFQIFMKDDKLYLEDGVSDIIKRIFESIRKKSQHFGNAREARNIYEAIKTAMSSRLAEDSSLKAGDKALFKITLEDIPLKYKNLANGSFREINQKSIDEALSNLEDVVGLASVKDNIHDIINNIKLSKRRNSTKFVPSGHFVFHGNPGTGKTMVANLMDDILTSLGVLEHGRMIEVTRSDLVGRHIGETALKTERVLESALGGVLFIDEAYALSKGSEKDFGREAIDTIVPFMEKHRDDFVLIVAGYEKEMQEFLDANTGLKSRFNHTIKFEDYDEHEMLEIFKKFVKSDGFSLKNGVEETLKQIFRLVRAKSEHFGNGRDARKLYNKICRNMNARLIKDESISGEKLNLILQVDLLDITF